MKRRASSSPAKLDLVIVAVVVVSAIIVELGADGIIGAVRASGALVLLYRIAYSYQRNGQQIIYVLNSDASEDMVPSGVRVARPGLVPGR